MFRSIKMKNSIIFIVVTVITIAVTTIVTLAISENFLNYILIYIAAIILLLLLSVFASFLISKDLSMQLRRFNRSMKNVIDGKLNDAKIVKEKTNVEEIIKTTNTFNTMLNIIRKNSFELNTQQNKTEIILEHMEDGVIAFSLTKDIVHMNKTAQRLLNITSAIGTYDILVKYLRINLKFDTLLYMPNYKCREQKIVINDNILNVVFAPFYSDDLNPIGVIMVVKNITESEKLNNMRKDFVANVSHEFKTPLTSIKGYSETIIDGEFSMDDIKRFCKVINDQANRMDRLVGDLLQLSRFDYNSVSWKKMVFDVSGLVEKSIEGMQIIAKGKEHTLEYIKDNEVEKIYADRDAIEQVIINILTNSIKYTPDGGKITVNVGETASKVYIKITDNGVGIPEEDLNRIFERFYRVDKARSREMGGTGLGLSIVREIIDGNDGTIDITSKVNYGTTVTILLPTANSKQ